MEQGVKVEDFKFFGSNSPDQQRVWEGNEELPLHLFPLEPPIPRRLRQVKEGFRCDKIVSKNERKGV